MPGALVSIGIPTYNRPDALKRILTIVTEQTYRNLEILISDNASTDPRVKEVAEEFAAVDSRVRYFRQARNTGVLENAQLVLARATGEFFAWISDDDWRAPEFIEFLVRALEGTPQAELAFCDYREVFENGQPAPQYPSSHLKIFRPLTQSSAFKRAFSFFWTDPFLGQGNLFYSLFRRKALMRLDLAQISGNYQRLNMDNLIAFAALQKSPAVIVPERLCSLTCGNVKHYEVVTHAPALSRSARILATIKQTIYEQKSYQAVTQSFALRLAFRMVFLPKCLHRLWNTFSPGLMTRISGDRTRPSSVCSYHYGEGPKIALPQVTLIALATKEVEETLQALEYSRRNIDFGAIKLISHYQPQGLARDIAFHRCQKFSSVDEWSKEVVYNLGSYVDTEFALLIHADGFVVNPQAWRAEFLNYDYIGAPWPLPTDSFSYRDPEGNIVRVGNSVSLRSKRLLDFPKKADLPWEPYYGYFNEDGFICVKNKRTFENAGMRFAPLDVAVHFAHEAMIPETEGVLPFAFHKWAGTNAKYPRFKA